jgi:hypothetical protein
VEPYDHRQIGMLQLLIIVVVAGGYAFSSIGGATVDSIMLIVVLALIGSAVLTTRVDQSRLRWWFTFGFPAGELAIEQIESVRRTRTNLIEGWGLHYTIWHGWLWNVGGFQAIELVHSGGRRLTIGTDDPDGLLAAIADARELYARSHAPR